MKIEIIREEIKRYAETICGGEELRTSEVCDFGDKYGFLFDAKNRYDNAYWCVDKQNYAITIFLPYTDAKLFRERKIIYSRGDENG